jgi:cysteine desulfuration protein SufE
MTDPFVQPTEPTAAAAIEAIREEFEFLDDGEMQFMQLMDYAKRLPTFPPQWQDETHLVPGCLAKVWLEPQLVGNRLMLAGTSNAMLVAGVVGLLLRVYSGRPADEVLATDPGFLATLGMPELTSNRKNGVVAMIGRIREAARAGVAAA